MYEKIKTVFFDIGGVLLYLHPERTLHHLHLCTGLSENILEEAFLKENHQTYETGELTDEKFFNNYKSSLPQPNGLVENDFFTAWLKLIGKPTGTMEVAQNLTRTYPVWLVSNTNPCHIRYGESKGYFHDFTGAVYSYEIGVRKPNKKFFKKALELTGATAQSTLFIDDRLENIQTAQELEFITIHYLSDKQMERDLKDFLSLPS